VGVVAVNTESQAVDFFRCPIQAEQANAALQIGWRKVPVVLRETSIDGFTVLVSPKYASRLRVGRAWRLKSQAETSVVHGEWMFMSPEGLLQLGLRRIADITPVERCGGSSWRSLLSPRRLLSRQKSPELAFGGALLLVVALISTPGIGGPLGTAKPIREAVGAVFVAVRGMF
jgi:hypothetical protein